MPGPVLKIQRTTLAEQIEAHMREQIVSHQLGEGESLPSSIELAAEFGVSRSIVREALKSLQANGLIEIANGRRARVRPVTSDVLVGFFNRFAQPHKDAVIQLLELRRGLEVQGALLAATRRTPEDMERIWIDVGAMEERIGDAEAFLDLDVQLHLDIVASSKNRPLFHLVESIREVMRDTMKEGLVRHSDAADWRKIQDSHVKLVTLVDRRDAEGAAACMASHFDEAIHGILTREPRALPLAGKKISAAARQLD
jgi:GntR family transcriptional regulator, transcriptional repressor for pyruvate dehydrogenase complex